MNQTIDFNLTTHKPQCANTNAKAYTIKFTRNKL